MTSFTSLAHSLAYVTFALVLTVTVCQDEVQLAVGEDTTTATLDEDMANIPPDMSGKASPFAKMGEAKLQVDITAQPVSEAGGSNPGFIPRTEAGKESMQPSAKADGSCSIENISGRYDCTAGCMNTTHMISIAEEHIILEPYVPDGYDVFLTEDPTYKYDLGNRGYKLTAWYSTTDDMSIDDIWNAAPRIELCLAKPDRWLKTDSVGPITPPRIYCMGPDQYKDPISSDELTFNENCDFNRQLEYQAWHILCEMYCVRQPATGVAG